MTKNPIKEGDGNSDSPCLRKSSSHDKSLRFLTQSLTRDGEIISDGSIFRIARAHRSWFFSWLVLALGLEILECEHTHDTQDFARLRCLMIFLGTYIILWRSRITEPRTRNAKRGLSPIFWPCASFIKEVVYARPNVRGLDALAITPLLRLAIPNLFDNAKS